jgi:hypothetical protein
MVGRSAESAVLTTHYSPVEARTLLVAVLSFKHSALKQNSMRPTTTGPMSRWPSA